MAFPKRSLLSAMIIAAGTACTILYYTFDAFSGLRTITVEGDGSNFIPSSAGTPDACRPIPVLQGQSYIAHYVNETYDDRGATVACSPKGCPCLEGLARKRGAAKCELLTHSVQTLDMSRAGTYSTNYWFLCGSDGRGKRNVITTPSVTRVVHIKHRPRLHVTHVSERYAEISLAFGAPVIDADGRAPLSKDAFSLVLRDVKGQHFPAPFSIARVVPVPAEVHTTNKDIAVGAVEYKLYLDSGDMSSSALPNVTLLIGVVPGRCIEAIHPFGHCASEYASIPLTSVPTMRANLAYRANEDQLTLRFVFSEPVQHTELSPKGVEMAKPLMMTSFDIAIEKEEPRPIWGTRHSLTSLQVVSVRALDGDAASRRPEYEVVVHLPITLQESGSKLIAGISSTVTAQKWPQLPVSGSPTVFTLNHGLCCSTVPGRAHVVDHPDVCASPSVFRTGSDSCDWSTETTKRPSVSPEGPADVRLELVGSSTVILYAGETYRDPGVRVIDERTWKLFQTKPKISATFDPPLDSTNLHLGVYLQTYFVDSADVKGIPATRVLDVRRSRPSPRVVGVYRKPSATGRPVSAIVLKFTSPIQSLDVAHVSMYFNGTPSAVTSVIYHENAGLYDVELPTLIQDEEFNYLHFRIDGQGCRDAAAPHGHCNVDAPLTVNMDMAAQVEVTSLFWHKDELTVDVAFSTVIGLTGTPITPEAFQATHSPLTSSLPHPGSCHINGTPLSVLSLELLRNGGTEDETPRIYRLKIHAPAAMHQETGMVFLSITAGHLMHAGSANPVLCWNSIIHETGPSRRYTMSLTLLGVIAACLSTLKMVTGTLFKGATIVATMWLALVGPSVVVTGVMTAVAFVTCFTM
ncbi:hypothetical protein BC832DRAFT_63621 [Gaertneriomyces semiglobifer]|nr:hypothetical protein BC832DRAFT_63621 [Gaertneriomyces semiglobifer]